MSKKRILLVFAIMGIMMIVSCSTSYDKREEARRKLAEMKIAFTQEAFFDSIKAGDVVAVQCFLNAGVNPNTREDKLGLTPLMVASIHGQKVIAEILLSYGADINMVSKNVGSFAHPEYKTALDFAKQYGYIELADMLVQKGGLGQREAMAKRIEEIVKKELEEEKRFKRNPTIPPPARRSPPPYPGR